MNNDNNYISTQDRTIKYKTGKRNEEKRKNENRSDYLKRSKGKGTDNQCLNMKEKHKKNENIN